MAYDRELIDDELAKLWSQFSQGVRIVMVSDSCNSGTNYRFMRTIDKSTPINFGQVPGMKAAMIHFSGCRDGGTSAGYQQGGAFTMALCEIWNGGNFFGTYHQLYEKIVDKLRSTGEKQEPQFNLVGNPLPDFLLSQPFTLLNKNIPDDSILGHYECRLYDQGGKNDWHYVTISKASDTTLNWANRAGVSWTLTVTSDKTKLNVSQECPYYNFNDGTNQTQYRQATIVWTENRVSGILGPWGELYEKSAT